MKLLTKKIKNKIVRILYRNQINKKIYKVKEFNKKYIKSTGYTVSSNKNISDLKKKYEIFVVGSDQVWNPNWRLSDIDLLTFADNNQKIAFSASFGVNSIPREKEENVRKNLKKFKAISVREDSAKKIVEELTKRKDVQVLIDPTMILTQEEWDKILKKPEQLKHDKYILNYFLGGLSKERKKEIYRIAEKNNCEVINVLDKRSEFYAMDPREFLYLEKHAFLICTDSFHSSVFGLLYDRPFIVFERDNTNINMNSRIETLLTKFNLENRKFSGKITKENIEHNYEKAYQKLEIERNEVNEFIEKFFYL